MILFSIHWYIGTMFAQTTSTRASSTITTVTVTTKDLRSGWTHLSKPRVRKFRCVNSGISFDLFLWRFQSFFVCLSKALLNMTHISIPLQQLCLIQIYNLKIERFITRDLNKDFHFFWHWQESLSVSCFHVDLEIGKLIMAVIFFLAFTNLLLCNSPYCPCFQ